MLQNASRLLKKVLRDIAKGRKFPVCVGYNGNIISHLTNEVYVTGNRKFICPDNTTKPYFTFETKNGYYRHFCRKINIDIPPDTASDSEHLHQTYYIDK